MIMILLTQLRIQRKKIIQYIQIQKPNKKSTKDFSIENQIHITPKTSNKIIIKTTKYIQHKSKPPEGSWRHVGRSERQRFLL